MKVLTRFLLSATAAEQFPAPGPPEIAFLGRSNVGKSSLINSLLGAKVARTRAINFFQIRHPGNPRPSYVFADLPGYGYAKLPRELSAEWPKFIEPYLLERPALVLCLVLVDINVPPQNSDLQLMEWLQSHQRPFAIVATKADKLSGNRRANARRALQQAFKSDALLDYSARTGDGRQELWRLIRDAAKSPEAPAEQ
jgi:GTP-binding protein